jgi:hypothetical protein
MRDWSRNYYMAASLRRFDFDAHRADTMHFLRTLKDFFETMEGQLLLAQKRDLTRIKKEFGPVRKKELEEYYGRESGNRLLTLEKKVSEYENHATRFEDSLPTYLRYSIITLLYFAFEARARAMCEELLTRRPKTVHRNLEKYMYVQKGKRREKLPFSAAVRRFLGNEVVVKIPNSKLWSDIISLEKVRHCIAHTNGLVKDSRDRKHLEQLARGRLGFGIGQDGYARIQASFCQRMQASVNEFFETIFERAHFGPEKLKMISWEEAQNDPYFYERDLRYRSAGAIQLSRYDLLP